MRKRRSLVNAGRFFVYRWRWSRSRSERTPTTLTGEQAVVTGRSRGSGRRIALNTVLPLEIQRG